MPEKPRQSNMEDKSSRKSLTIKEKPPFNAGSQVPLAWLQKKKELEIVLRHE